MKSLIHQLFELGAIKFGNFTLKSGIASPIYIDLRVAISSPRLLVEIAKMMFEKVKGKKIDLVCGVPYTAIPIATAISIQHSIPMILKRKEKKEHGTAKLIEGIFQPDQHCLLIEDVITSGQSVFETIVSLSKEGLIVEEIAVLVDREQGGCRFLKSKGFKVHPICTITSIVEELQKQGKITPQEAINVKEFIKNHQTYGI